MKLGGHRPGSLTAFIDTATNEVLLEIAADENGAPLIGFHLYDRNGTLVSETEGRVRFPEGLHIVGESQETLLLLPSNPDENIHYRIYSSVGKLLTASDGQRTQIYGNLRLDAAKVERRTQAQ